MDDIFTVAQAAQYLQVCEKTVRRLISRHALPASKVGCKWRIKRSDIDEYLNDHANNTKEVNDNE